LIVVGRTDTLELDFNVDERDIGRVKVGDEVRLRVDAYPQRTFVGRVTVIGVDRWTGERLDSSNGVTTSASMAGYPLRALVPNDSGLIRPGMVAYARVLTGPASVMGRVVREPWRRLRLFWWRLWS
jgi:multidrug efflux pump subunit AcrA (membrane-fusion protein)